MKHDDYSLSKAHRWLACPGCVRRCAGIADAPSPAATRGTLIHAACQALAIGGASPAELSPEDVALAADMVAAGAQAAARYLDIEDAMDVCEMEVDASVLGMERPGAADRVWIGADIAVVLDYKSGLLPVDAVGNAQGAGYCVCVAKAAGVRRAVFVVVQPSQDGDSIVVRDWLLEAEDLDAWEARLRAGRRLALALDVLTPGEHCRYCPASEVCEARMSSLLVPRDLDSWAPHWASLDAQARGELLRRAKAAKDQADDILKHAKLDAQASGLVPEGWRFKRGAKREFWSDESQVTAALTQALAELGAPEHNGFRREPLTPKELAKAGLIPKAYWGHLVGVKENEPSLVEA